MNDFPVETRLLPPQAIEAEQSVLGGLMLDNGAWDRVADVVGERDFYRADHRRIFRAIETLVDCSMPADVLTVADALGDDLQAVGGREYLGSLVVEVPSAANIRHYAETVRDRSVKRGLIVLCNQALEALYRRTEDPPAELIGRLEDGLAALATVREGKTRTWGAILADVLDGIEKRQSAGGHDITGLETGFKDLDHMTAGFQPGDLIVIAGRPSMGKSAIAMNIVEHVAVKLKKSCAVFSLEMSDAQLAQRMIGSVGRVNQHQLRTGRMTDEDWHKVGGAYSQLSPARVVIEETYDLKPGSLRAKARRIKRENPDLALIVIDYLQLLDGEAEKRVDAVAEITRGLKKLAKEMNIPVVALSQLNRSVEARTNKRPMMADLRESGAIEQDADVILFMFREEVYDPETPNPGLAEVIIGKQRNGPIGHVYLTFIAQYARFENFTGTIQHKQYKARSKPFETRQRADIDN